MTEEQRGKVIEERAKDICLRFVTMGEPYKSRVWEQELHKDFYIDQAIEQLDWFCSHGMDIPDKDTKIKTAKDIFEELESKGENWVIPWEYETNEAHFCFKYFDWNDIKTKYLTES